MNQFLEKYWLTIFGVGIGALGGYIYFYFWGCENGCPIKSNPWKMMIYGALMGGLLFNMLQDFIEKRSKKK